MLQRLVAIQIAVTNHLKKNQTSEVFSFSKVDKPTVLKNINDFPAKSSRGFDGISIKLLKSIKYEILDAVTIVINQSLRQGIFPNKLKLARVIPLHKKGRSNLYR